MTRNELKTLIVDSDGKIFGVAFIKKSGELREGTFRLGVKKFLVHGGPSTVAHLPQYVTAFDMVKGDYRNINLDTIIRLSINGEVLTIS